MSTFIIAAQLDSFMCVSATVSGEVIQIWRFVMLYRHLKLTETENPRTMKNGKAKGFQTENLSIKCKTHILCVDYMA